MRKRKTIPPRYITIVHSPSSIAWFNHWIGETFKVLDISEYDFAQIEYMEGFKGWVPLDCCEKHHFPPRPKAIESTELPSAAGAV